MTNSEGYFLNCWNTKKWISKNPTGDSELFLKTLNYYLLFLAFKSHLMLCLDSSPDRGEICRSQFPCPDTQILQLTTWDSVRCWAFSFHNTKYVFPPLRRGLSTSQDWEVYSAVIFFFLESAIGGFGCLMITTSISGPCLAELLSTKWAMEETTYPLP